MQNIINNINNIILFEIIVIALIINNSYCFNNNYFNKINLELFF